MKRSRFSTYNDGVLYVCKEVRGETDFGAVKNARSFADVETIMKLAYTEMSKRDEDLEFAESRGRALSLKVKTRLHPAVKKTDMVTIEKTLYSIINLDQDRSNGEMYFYLEEVRKIS